MGAADGYWAVRAAIVLIACVAGWDTRSRDEIAAKTVQTGKKPAKVSILTTLPGNPFIFNRLREHSKTTKPL